MKRLLLSLTSIVAATLASVHTTAAEPTKIGAEQLVGEALEAGLAGDMARRRSMLEAALAKDPDMATPNWHLGHVRIDDEWMTITEAEAIARADKKLKAYVLQRAKYAGTVVGEARLAAWCGRNGLTGQSLAHWYQVLRFDPQNKLALRALDARWYRGVLLKNTDADTQKQLDEQLQRELLALNSKVRKWRWSMIEGDDEIRTSALADLRALRGDLAIMAISKVLLEPTDDKVRTAELQLKAMELLGSLDHLNSVPILSWHASLSKDDAVRQAAKSQLTRRPLHEYVPVLLAGLQMPVEAALSTEVFEGRVATNYTFEQQGPAGKQLRSRRTSYQAIPRPELVRTFRQEIVHTNVPTSFKMVTDVM